MIALHPRFVLLILSAVEASLFLFYLQHYVNSYQLSSFVVNKGGNNNFIPNWNF